MNEIDVKIRKCNILALGAKGIVVPQFADNMCLTGVAGIVSHGGHYRGLLDYAIAARQMRLPYGYALTTKGCKGVKLINLSLLGVPEAEAFNMVQLATFSALAEAEKQGLSSIAVSALGTGKSGSLGFKKSAKAMLSAIESYQEYAQGCLKKVSICLFKSDNAFAAFNHVMETKEYSAYLNRELDTRNQLNRDKLMRKAD